MGDGITLLSAQKPDATIPTDAGPINLRFHVRLACACSVYLIAAITFGLFTNVHIENLAHTVAVIAVGSGMVLLLPAYWHSRGKTRLRDAALTIPWIFVLFSILPMLIFPAARLAMPLQDAHLAALDQSLGVYLPALIAWASHHWFGHLANRSYALLTPTLAISFWVPSLTGKVKHIQTFLAANLAAFAVGMPLFALFPAIGPWYGYHFAPTPDQLKCQLSLLQLRVPGHFVFHPAPIVCFPSFHVAWAIMCAVAYWGFRPLRIPYCVLASMIILSTMTTGWHYFSDVLGGILLACISLAFAKVFTHNCYSEAGSTTIKPPQATST
jgi:membrane-associated phospholipid phosphatase